MQLCIVPTDDSQGVRRITFSGDKEVLSETVVADGTPRTVPEKECTGTQTSRWATSGARLLVSSTLTCPGKPQVITTGMSAMLSPDQWLDIQTIKTADHGEQTRVQRFWRSDSQPPAAVAGVLAAHPIARIKMQAPSVDDVIDASAVVDPSVVEAWLSEGAVSVPVARPELLRLSNAHVDARVIDLMVAMAYPKKFEVRRQTYSGSASGVGMLSDYYPGDWGILASQYGLGYGIYGVPYFFGAYGFDQPGGLYFIQPPAGAAPTEPATHGQVVNGQGYTRVQMREPFRGTASATNGSTRGTASDSGASSGSGSSGDSGASASSGASPAGYSGGGGSSTGLTAVPR